MRVAVEHPSRQADTRHLIMLCATTRRRWPAGALGFQGAASMGYGLFISLALLAGLLVGLEVGRFAGLRYRQRHDGAGSTAAADGVVFALLGLMIAFMFTTSAGTFNQRRELIVDQANELGTAWIRLDLLDPDERAAVRQPMREWTVMAATLSEWYSQPDFEDRMRRSEQLQMQAWDAAVAALRDKPPATTSFVLTPMNAWIDLTAKRSAMDGLGLPPMVLPTLIVIALLGSVLAGFGMARKPHRSPLHMAAFALAIAFALYVTLDLNHARSGAIRVDAMDHEFTLLLQSYDAPHTDTPAPLDSSE